MNDENNKNIGYYEDLIAELDLKLIELVSHIKLIANATGIARDFEITPEDINALAVTVYDKTINAQITVQKLKHSLNDLQV